MVHETFIKKNFSNSSLNVIETARDIIDAYRSDGFSVTLRQLYYQFVARDFLPNTNRSYKRLGAIISDARRAGMIDWNAIEDRTRFVRDLTHWEKPSEIIESAIRGFRIDKWANQKHRIFVFIEKDALIGVVERICAELDVPCFSCRGYPSDSSLWRIAKQMQQYLGPNYNQQLPVVLHLGDHDPSGIDMTVDLSNRLLMFAEGYISIHRIALNMDQIERFNPPPNPAKITDSRAKNYIKAFGDKSWELDALEPKFINSLVRDSILELRDEKAWKKSVRIENKMKAELKKAKGVLNDKGKK